MPISRQRTHEPVSPGSPLAGAFSLSSPKLAGRRKSLSGHEDLNNISQSPKLHDASNQWKGSNQRRHSMGGLKGDSNIAYAEYISDLKAAAFGGSPSLPVSPTSPKSPFGMKSPSGSAINVIKDRQGGQMNSGAMNRCASAGATRSLLVPDDSPKCNNSRSLVRLPPMPAALGDRKPKNMAAMATAMINDSIQRKLSKGKTPQPHSEQGGDGKSSPCEGDTESARDPTSPGVKTEMARQTSEGKVKTEMARQTSEGLKNPPDTPITAAPSDGFSDEKSDDEKETGLATPTTGRPPPAIAVESEGDMSFVVPGAPTLKEAYSRLQLGQFFEGEHARMHMVYRRFSAREEDMNKECLELLSNFMGYIQIPEDELQELADNVTEMSSYDLEELLSFLQELASGQNAVLEAAFAKLTNTDPNSISPDELSSVLRDLRVMTPRKNREELLQRAGLTGQDRLTCDDVAKVLAAYRVCEGFTAKDLKKAEESFEEAAEDGTLPLTELANALLDFFGVQCIKQLRALLEVAGVALEYSGPTSTCGVAFHEFLCWARYLQNADMLELYDYFDTADEDKDGVISFEELMGVMKRAGFTLFSPEDKEFLGSAELPDDKDSFSFDDVHAYLLACRESDGFGQGDYEELTAAYNKFDSKDEGELTTIQVLDCLRFLGYQVQVRDVESYAKEVDFNGNGTMDVNEYMALMRLHREDDIRNVTVAFQTRVGSKDGHLEFKYLHDALMDSKCCSSHCDVFDELCEGAVDKETQETLTFNEFKVLADKGRKAVKRAQRKKANFSDTEFLVLQQAFAEHDIKGQGFLEQSQLYLLLHKSGIPIHKSDQRIWAFDMLDKARQSALDADISPDDVGNVSDTNSVTFWTMVHAWRLITRSNECKKVSRLERARVASNFSVIELDEFYKIFKEWLLKKSDDQEEVENEAEKKDQKRRRSMPELYTSSSKAMQQRTVDVLSTVAAVGKDSDISISKLPAIIGMDTGNEELTFPNFKRLLGSLHVRVGPAHVRTLEKEMQMLTGDADGSLDFANFLRMMRWMLDTDFAHLNELASDLAKAPPGSAAEAADLDSDAAAIKRRASV